MDMFFSILKWSSIVFIVIVLIIIKQEVLFKDSKKVGWVSLVILYILAVLMFVLNDVFGFMNNNWGIGLILKMWETKV